MFDKQTHVSNNSLSSWKMQSSQVNDHGVVSIQEKVSSREGNRLLPGPYMFRQAVGCGGESRLEAWELGR